MFRNPRENVLREPHTPVKPSIGRPPSPVASSTLKINGSRYSEAPMNTVQTTPGAGGRSNGTILSTSAPKNGRPKPKANSSILSFFKKAEDGSGRKKQDIDSLFIGDDGHTLVGASREELASSTAGQDEFLGDGGNGHDQTVESLFHESGESRKRRKTSPSFDGSPTRSSGSGHDSEVHSHDFEQTFISSDKVENTENPTNGPFIQPVRHKVTKQVSGPFFDDSDSEDDRLPDRLEEDTAARKDRQPDGDSRVRGIWNGQDAERAHGEDNLYNLREQVSCSREKECSDLNETRPSLSRKSTSCVEDDGFLDFENMGDFEDEYDGGEEYTEKQWQLQQQLLDNNGGFEGELPNDDLPDVKYEADSPGLVDEVATIEKPSSASSCPVCSASLAGVSDQDASVHVNNCLDGNPSPLPDIKATPANYKGERDAQGFTKFAQPKRPAKPGQENPFNLADASGTSSAFSKLMSGHTEESAWATAAAAEHASRGKPAYQRTCPFYKILPGFFICVDAFRYGAVEGCNAYFLSHFHSDHYIGLTANWSNGPIYCSRVTANLVKQQLRVDPKRVKPLEFEEKVEVPNTGGVHVTMIPANHCPGSSLYLYEKAIGRGKTPKMQRVLHCGDFRACPAHIEHPLLKPEVMDIVTGKTSHQKIDVCYLDTTYLNPRYAFPSQEDVITACSDMCISLNKTNVDEKDDYEQMKRERAGGSMAKFVRKDSKDEELNGSDSSKLNDGRRAGNRGALLVVVGTYSIGKERICLGIARALGSKIYAPPGKQRICAALEDLELNARLTSDPRAAQVHMTPLFEIRAETLCEYLAEYSDRFTRAVGFRPSGWNYRPPGSRFTDSPAVSAVLYSDNWKSTYTMKELVPQRGSTSKASCFGVPYSEHSSFRELTLFCCGLNIEKIIPTVNVGSARSRERMKMWCDRWAMERKKNGLFKIKGGKDDPGNGFYPAKGTWELKKTL